METEAIIKSSQLETLIIREVIEYEDGSATIICYLDGNIESTDYFIEVEANLYQENKNDVLFCIDYALYFLSYERA